MKSPLTEPFLDFYRQGTSAVNFHFLTQNVASFSIKPSLCSATDTPHFHKRTQTCQGFAKNTMPLCSNTMSLCSATDTPHFHKRTQTCQGFAKNTMPGPGCIHQLRIKCEFSATIPFVLEDFLARYHGQLDRRRISEYRNHKGSTRKSFGTQGTVAKKSHNLKLFSANGCRTFVVSFYTVYY